MDPEVYPWAERFGCTIDGDGKWIYHGGKPAGRVARGRDQVSWVSIAADGGLVSHHRSPEQAVLKLLQILYTPARGQ